MAMARAGRRSRRSRPRPASHGRRYETPEWRRAGKMPELPEVETIRRDLDKEVAGKRIKTVEVTGLRSIRRHANKKQFIARLEGAKIEGASRKGKNLLIDLGDDLLVVHLGMSGQLLKA